jgi:hypothetical protein
MVTARVTGKLELAPVIPASTSLISSVPHPLPVLTHTPMPPRVAGGRRNRRRAGVRCEEITAGGAAVEEGSTAELALHRPWDAAAPPAVAEQPRPRR